MSVIATNTSANTTSRLLGLQESAKAKSAERLSTGLRINRAADDAAGLSISEGLKSQVQGLTQAARNTQDGINLLNTFDDAISRYDEIFQRVRALAVQASNDTNSNVGLQAIGKEIEALGAEAVRLFEDDFHGIKLFHEAQVGLSFMVGSGATSSSVLLVTASTTDLLDQANNLLTVGATLATTTANKLGDVAPNFGFNLIDAADAALGAAGTIHTELGAITNRFTQALNHIQITKENLTQAKSTITDVDMAEEMVSYSSANVLAQAGTSMLAQANQSGQSVLKLLS